MHFWLSIFMAVAFISMVPQEGNSQTKQAISPPAQPEKPKMQMDASSLTILIKSTIMAIQHANITGNYSVIRDLGTPVFRERFDQVQLTAMFSNIRNRGINFSPIIIYNPTLNKQPEINDKKQLRLIGFFPTQPLQIQFDLLMQQIDGNWRIEEIGLDATQIKTAENTQAPTMSSMTPESKTTENKWSPNQPTAKKDKKK